MSPNDELVLMAVRKGHDTIIKISNAIHMDRQSTRTYLIRLKDQKYIKVGTCKTCLMTRTYIPV